MADPTISSVIDWLHKGHRPSFDEIRPESREVKFFWENYDSLRIIEDILVRELDPPDMMIGRQIVLPWPLRDEALKQCHSSLTAGHFGVGKTLELMRRRFIWYGMHRDTELFCKQCDTCSQYKTDGRKRRAPLKTQVTGTPMERVCLDILG